MPAYLALVLRGAATWLGRIGLAAFGVNEIQKLVAEHKDYLDQSAQAAEAGGMTEDDTKKLVAATTYDQVEQRGQNPNDFWAGLTPAEKEALKFSPESLQNDIGRTKFLGISSALLFAGSLVASGIAAARGIPVLLSTLAKLRDARATGATALELMTIIEEGKILGIAKVWVPGIVAGIAAGGGWLTSGMANSLNDATLWGKINLGQAADDFEKAQNQGSFGRGGGFGGASSYVLTPRTRVTTQKSAKPKVYVGTILGGKIANTPSMVRLVDDEITDEQDLLEDAKINMVRWLSALPGKITYEIQIKFNPFDENQVRRQGYWVTLALYVNNSINKRLFVDEILLGPIDPVKYYPEERLTQTLQVDLPRELTPTEIKTRLDTDGRLLTLDNEGNIVKVFGAQESAPRATEIPVRPYKTVQEVFPELPADLAGKIERGEIKEGDYVPGLGVLKPDGTFAPDTRLAGTQEALSPLQPIPTAPPISETPIDRVQIINGVPTILPKATPQGGPATSVGYMFVRTYVNGIPSYEVVPGLNVPFGYERITEEEYRRATGDTKAYIQSGYVIIGGVPYTEENARALGLL